MSRFILASGSEIRQKLLARAGLSFAVEPARVDETALTAALLAEEATPRDIADMLAEHKALKVSRKTPTALVIGCDQVLSLDGRLIHKPRDREDCRAQLQALRGKRHDLYSAAVICRDGQAIWRTVSQARMTVRAFSDPWLEGYIERNWPAIGESAGSYRLEEEGVRLFTRVEGDYFAILGLPLLELLAFLTERGDLDG
jgi:septum formation protein